MNFTDYIITSFKNLFRRKARTFLTVSAITIGSLAVILLVSISTTIKKSLDEMFKEMDAFTLITVMSEIDADAGGSLIKASNDSPSEGKKLDDTVVAKLKNLPDVVDATPIGGQIWMNKARLEGQEKKTWPNVLAYDPATKVFAMPVLAGRQLRSDDMDKIVVGSRFVKMYGYADEPEKILGKKIIFTMGGGGGEVPDWGGLLPVKPPQNANKEWWEEQSKKSIEIKAEIVGVAKSAGFDDSQNYINIAWAKRLMTFQRWEYPECKENEPCTQEVSLVKTDNFTRNGYGSIILKVNDMKNLAGAAKSVENLGYGISTAEDMVKEINDAIFGISIVLGAIAGIALFVAGIGIINTMVMATLERTREIGVLRSCGATKKMIRRIFTFEAAMLGFWGGVFGLVISYGIGKIANYAAERYISDVDLPISQITSFPWWLVIGVLTFTTLIGLFSGLGPAIKAARLNPVEALRYE